MGWKRSVESKINNRQSDGGTVWRWVEEEGEEEDEED
jgi:hypothetical protein